MKNVKIFFLFIFFSLSSGELIYAQDADEFRKKISTHLATAEIFKHISNNNDLISYQTNCYNVYDVLVLSDEEKIDEKRFIYTFNISQTAYYFTVFVDFEDFSVTILNYGKSSTLYYINKRIWRKISELDSFKQISISKKLYLYTKYIIPYDYDIYIKSNDKLYTFKKRIAKNCLLYDSVQIANDTFLFKRKDIELLCNNGKKRNVNVLLSNNKRTVFNAHVIIDNKRYKLKNTHFIPFDFNRGIILYWKKIQK